MQQGAFISSWGAGLLRRAFIHVDDTALQPDIGIHFIAFLGIVIPQDHLAGVDGQHHVRTLVEGEAHVQDLDVHFFQLHVVHALHLGAHLVFGKAAAEAVADGRADRGIVCCGTGIGISIAANKVKGIRCALCTDVHMAEMTRRHNDANMLAMGGRTTDEKTALEITAAWLDTEFEGGRHQRRVDMLNNM